ncbi:hypothetical protein V5O48_013701 [Marasmius crinis-equi]|uniref:Terpene synthase n=1 Tax=Marasmius crinis-equi TaxID=585013 RepID=A0ABR3EZR2_9AGAR
MAGTTYILPQTLRTWPWQRRINPFHDSCKEESDSWIGSFGAFDQKSQRAFERCNFALLASLAYPLLNKDGNRLACDLMILNFVIDEYTDVVSAEEARRLCDIVMDALKNPQTPRPVGEWVGGEITRQFWENAIKTGSPSFQRRFVQAFQGYLDAVVEQAIDRGESRIRDVETYFQIRRQTIGAFPSFTALGIHMNLPDEVLLNPVVARLEVLAVDMIILCNDFCSYNVEQARGDDSHNIIRVIVDLYSTDIASALDYIASLHERLSHDFLELVPEVPKLGDDDLDIQVSAYVDGLGNWVRANDCWSFESHRYFGNQGLEIQAERVVKLLPKIQASSCSHTGATGSEAIRTLLFEGLKEAVTYLYGIVFGFSPTRVVAPPAATEIIISGTGTDDHRDQSPGSEMKEVKYLVQ